MKKKRIIILMLALMAQASFLFAQNHKFKHSIGISGGYGIRDGAMGLVLGYKEIIEWNIHNKYRTDFIYRIEQKKQHLDVLFGTEVEYHLFNSRNGHLYTTPTGPGFYLGDLAAPAIILNNWVLGIRYNRYIVGSANFSLFGIAGINYRTYSDAGYSFQSASTNDIELYTLKTQVINEHTFFTMDLGIKNRFQTRWGFQFEAMVFYNRPFGYQYESIYTLNSYTAGFQEGTYKVRGNNFTFAFNVLVPINAKTHKRLNKDWYNW